MQTLVVLAVLPPIVGVSVGACVVPDALGPCAPSPPPCGQNEVCITGACHTLCF